MVVLDAKTKELYHSLNVRRKMEGTTTPWPLLKAQQLVGNRIPPAYFRGLYLTENYRQQVESYSHKPYYSECYRCLGYIVYGYGYLSNNERRNAGLKARRFRRRNG